MGPAVLCILALTQACTGGARVIRLSPITDCAHSDRTGTRDRQRLSRIPEVIDAR